MSFPLDIEAALRIQATNIVSDAFNIIYNLFTVKIESTA